PPVENKQLLEPVQQFAGDFLDLGAFGGAQLRRGAGEDVEDDQFFFGHIFANVSLLFFVQVAAQFQQLLEQFFDVPAASVVGLNQFLKCLCEVGACLVQANQFLQLGADRRFQDFQVGVPVLRFFEPFPQSLEVNL